MWILLLLAFLSPFILIGYLVTKLDEFLAGGGVVGEEVKVPPAAIVFGGGSLAKEVTAMLEKNKVRVFLIREPFLLENKQHFQFLFALSDNDADNIVLCKIGRRIYGIDKMVCLCNDRLNKRLFSNEKICFLFAEEATAHLFYQTVLQKTGVEL